MKRVLFKLNNEIYHLHKIFRSRKRKAAALILIFCMILQMLPNTTVTVKADTPLGTNLLFNPGGELGTPQDGTIELAKSNWAYINVSRWYSYSSLTTITPKSGNYFMACNNPMNNSTGDITCYQDIDISSLSSSIDANSITMTLSGWLRSANGSTAKLQIQQLDQDGYPVSDIFEKTRSMDSWGQESISELVLPSTRMLRVSMTANFTKSGVVALDDLSLTLNSNDNQAPVISTIATQHALSGELLGPLSFSVTDSDTSLNNLTAKVTSSEQALIPDSAINCSLKDGIGTINLTPLSGKTGQATITVAVSDGITTSRTTFQVSVSPPMAMGSNLVTNGDGSSLDGWVNDEGRMISGQAFVVGTVSSTGRYYITQTINIGKYRDLISAGLLTFSTGCTLANYGECIFQGLDALGSVIWEKSGTQSEIPIPTSTQKIIVKAGGRANASIDNISFMIDTNTLPNMSTISDQPIEAGSTTVAIPFTVAYADGFPNNLNVHSSDTNVIPTENISFGGIGYNRTITIAAPQNASGTSTITIYSDGTEMKNFRVTIPKAKPTATLSIAPATSVKYGETITLTATVSGGKNPTGTVQFMANGSNIGSPVTLENNVATISFPAVAGTTAYSAFYSGDTINENCSTNVINYSVDKANQAPLTITSAATHTFGTTYTPTVTGGSTGGKVTYQVTGGTGAGSFQDNVLTITKAGTITFTATMPSNNNYNEVTSNEFTLTVNKATPSITIPEFKNVLYSKTSSPYTDSDVNKGGSDGTVTFHYYKDSSYTNEVTTPLKVGSYYVKATMAETDNYYSSTSDATIMITPKPVSITGVTVYNKVYDGTYDATIKNSGTIDGVEPDDSVSIQTGSCTFNDKNANDSVGVTATGFALIGEDSNNYVLFYQPNVAPAAITKKTLTVTVPPISIVAGQTLPALTVTITGFIGEEDESNLLSFVKPNAITSTVDTTRIGTTTLGLAYSGGNSTNNYDFHYEYTTTLTITPPIISEQDYAVSRDINQWQKESITITPQNGYTQISTDKVDWKEQLVANDGDYDLTFYLKKENGVVTAGKTIHLKIDTSAPTGDITIHENHFRSFINTITNGVFCKDYMEVAISGADNNTTTIQYMICDSEDTSGHTYQDYKGAFRLSNYGTHVVYAKITDIAGNETILRSDGVIVYEDSTPDTSKITYRKDSSDNTTAIVNLKGNTIREVYIGTEKLASTQYTVTGNTIMLARSYLDSLALGNYTATVHYNPQGYAYEPTNSSGDVTYNHDAPATTSFIIEVVQKEPTANDFTFNPPANLMYNKEQKHASIEAKQNVNGIGKIKVNYYKGDQKLDAAPVDAGSYTVKVDISEGSNYSAVTNLTVGTFTITKATQSAPTSPYGVKTTTLLNNDGQIKEVDNTMEYKMQSQNTWTPVKASEIKNLSDGTYLIRYAETANYSVSDAKSVVIERYMGIIEAKPTATFKATTKTLSGLKNGQKYRINQGQWTDVPSNQTLTINAPCTIDVFMPGDGIHTLDSDIQTIAITKAPAPSVTVVHESYSGKNDGQILGTNSTMEYKSEHGSWTTVTGNTINNLAPGQYYVRIKVMDSILESDAVSLMVKAGKPEYSNRTILNDSKDASLSGNLTGGALLKVKPITYDTGNKEHLNIRIDNDKETVIGAFEVSIVNGHYNGDLTLSFHVGTKYDGKTLTIYHKKADGSVETYTTLCKNGKATITVKELSPFVITVAKETKSPTNNPKTGDSTNLGFWVHMIIASLFILLFITYRTRKHKITHN